jgi:hypothetical protein
MINFLSGPKGIIWVFIGLCESNTIFMGQILNAKQTFLIVDGGSRIKSISRW